jgi:hypothetical protein
MRARGCLAVVLTPSESRGVLAHVLQSTAHRNRWAVPKTKGREACMHTRRPRGPRPGIVLA